MQEVDGQLQSCRAQGVQWRSRTIRVCGPVFAVVTAMRNWYSGAAVAGVCAALFSTSHSCNAPCFASVVPASAPVCSMTALLERKHALPHERRTCSRADQAGSIVVSLLEHNCSMACVVQSDRRAWPTRVAQSPKRWRLPTLPLFNGDSEGASLEGASLEDEEPFHWGKYRVCGAGVTSLGVYWSPERL